MGCGDRQGDRGPARPRGLCFERGVLARTARASSPPRLTGRRGFGMRRPPGRSRPCAATESGSFGFSAVYSAAFSSDGARIVTASADKTARLWNVGTIPMGNLFEIACAELSDHDLSDIAKDYGLTNLEPICQDTPPPPDRLAQ